MSSTSLVSGLPPSYLTHIFTDLDALRTTAQHVLDRLNQNLDSGNQFILVLNLPAAIRTKLDEDKNALNGIAFRFMFECNSGLIKIIPSYAHGAPTRHLSTRVALLCMSAGADMDDFSWAATTTYRPTVGNSGKQPDDCFLPRSREGRTGKLPDWPTLVIETGVSESLPRLREDAKWWFQNSEGAVRFVIILSIRRARRTIILEKWQLSPPGQPVTPAMALNIQPSPVPPMPPLVQQPAASQVPFLSQTVTITPHTITGSLPLYLHFHALFDRAPQPPEGDIELDAQTLIAIARNL